VKMEINDKMDGVVKKDGKLRAFSSDNVYLAPSPAAEDGGEKVGKLPREPRFRRWVARKVRSRQSGQSASTAREGMLLRRESAWRSPARCGRFGWVTIRFMPKETRVCPRNDRQGILSEDVPAGEQARAG